LRRRLKRSTRGHIMVLLFCFIIMGGAFLTAFIVVTKDLKKNYQNQIATLSREMDMKKVYVYQAKSDIKAGSKLTKDMVSYTRVLSEQPQANFMTESDLGKVLLIDIKRGTEVLKSMLTEDLADNTLREVEFQEFLLSSNLKENDSVDIRILYPNGENYVVLSKKSTKNLDLENLRCFMWLNSEEILRISGAIVDCYLNEGTILYTVKYINPRIQEASHITYTPNANVLKLMREDPNIVKKASDTISENLRQELENRLAQFYSTYGDEASWNNSIASAYSRVQKKTNDLSGDENNSVATDNDSKTGQTGENEEEIYYVD
jgi:hypothetical protein